MADNFNLRQFLTENKLTKNAKLLKEAVALDGKPVDISSIEIDDIDTSDYPDFSDAYISYAEYEDGTPLSEEELMKLEDQNYGITNELIHDRQMYMEAKKETKEEGVESLDENIDVIAQLIDMFPFLTNSTAAMLLGAFGAAGLTGFAAIAAKVQQMALKGNFGEKAKAFAQKLEKAGGAAAKARNVSEVETIQETLTAKERRLVEMVHDALGVTKEVHQNADPAVPNDSTDMAIDMMKNGLPEGDEMVDENPLPKYKNIDELMSNIEHGTNEAAHKYKMGRMKEIADALEAKVTSLEEGENAEHIDQKAVKQMRKDILALRKAEEKLRKEFDKKFAAKKEKKEDK